MPEGGRDHRARLRPRFDPVTPDGIWSTTHSSTEARDRRQMRVRCDDGETPPPPERRICCISDEHRLLPARHTRVASLGAISQDPASDSRRAGAKRKDPYALIT